jgi:hypothetical protein
LVPNVNQVVRVRRRGHNVPAAARSRPLNWTRTGRGHRASMPPKARGLLEDRR